MTTNIQRVKTLKVQKSSLWVKNTWPAKGIDPWLWEDDLLIRVPRVGEVMVKKLKNEKITAVSKLKTYWPTNFDLNTTLHILHKNTN